MPSIVVINREQFILRDAGALQRLRADILDAVRAGGAFVSVGASTDAPQVLVTASTPVRIDTAADDDLVVDDHTAEPVIGTAPLSPVESVDFDYDAY